MTSPNSQSNPQCMRDAATSVVRTLQDAGYQALFAGGCVRDHIMQRDPTDYDVATNADPQKVLQLFKRSRAVGEAFGVVMVGIKKHWIEVATFRTEWGYSDGRHPDTVEYSDAEHDAQRRDFTINGIFYDPIADNLVDYVNGESDIHAQTIRAIGEPAKRFSEDYLRMLRAVRFAARLDFTIEPVTANALTLHAPKLTGISRERIGAEVQMMLTCPQRARAASLLQKHTLDAPTLNETSITPELPVLATLPSDAPYPLALAAWALDRELPTPDQPTSIEQTLTNLKRLKPVQIARRWRAALMLSNDARDQLKSTLKTIPLALTWHTLNTAQKKRAMAHKDWPFHQTLTLALITAHRIADFDTNAFHAETRTLTEQGVAPTPLITGDDLIAAGFDAGPAFRMILDTVYDAQLTHQITTRDQALALAHALQD